MFHLVFAFTEITHSFDLYILYFIKIGVFAFFVILNILK